MSDTVEVIVCDRCSESLGQSPTSNEARSLLLLAHWRKKPACDAAPFSYREDRLSDRARGRLTYASVEAILEEAYEDACGEAVGEHGVGWQVLAKELWGLIKADRKRRRTGGADEEE